jgi:arginyl-tRNA synthetase
LLRKSAEAASRHSSFISSPSSFVPHEREILRLLFQYPEIVTQAGEELSPALVANYLYELAREYNQFYQEIPVLREEDQDIVRFRLKLSAFTGSIIRKGMGLLGIEVPHRM